MWDRRPQLYRPARDVLRNWHRRHGNIFCVNLLALPQRAAAHDAHASRLHLSRTHFIRGFCSNEATSVTEDKQPCFPVRASTCAATYPKACPSLTTSTSSRGMRRPPPSPPLPHQPLTTSLAHYPSAKSLHPCQTSSAPAAACSYRQRCTQRRIDAQRL